MHSQHRRWYFSAYGYQKRVNGLPTRPILPRQVDHIELLKSVVTFEELKNPNCYGYDFWVPRTVIPEDHLKTI